MSYSNTSLHIDNEDKMYVNIQELGVYGQYTLRIGGFKEEMFYPKENITLFLTKQQIQSLQFQLTVALHDLFELEAVSNEG